MTATHYRHPEAYCLMTYRSDDGTEEEVLWNSRDGVTPFVITLRSGKQATHVDWHNDQRVPDYQPAPGTRLFVDLTEDRAHELARSAAQAWFDDPTELGQLARSEYRTVDDMAAMLATQYLQVPGAPDIADAFAVGQV
jgi:hypothetical protein